MTNQVPENYNDLCRLCATYDAIRMDIFSESGRERKLVDKITTCLPFEVSEDDLYPKSLCFRCIYNLETFYDFRRGCINAKAKLESVLKIPKVEVKEPISGTSKSEKVFGLKVDVDDAPSEEDETPNPADFLEASLVSGESPRSSHGKHYDEDEGSFVCKICGRLFNTKNSLATHAKYHQDKTREPDREPYSCYVCEKVFSSKGHLALHSRVHIGETSTPSLSNSTRSSPAQIRLYRCDLCNKSYSMAKHLWGHVSTCHKGDPLVTCNICFRTFSSTSNLEDHKRVKHKDEQQDKNNQQMDLREMDCDTNDPKGQDDIPMNRRKNSKPRKIEKENSETYSYNSDENMGVAEQQQQLPQTMPSKLPFYSCFLCPVKCTDTQSLADHLMTIHGYDGSRDFENIHGTFGEGEFVDNMMEAETVFCCEICIREFNDRASLWLHMLYSHRDEASKACGICLKICNDNEGLSQHVEACHPRNKTEQRRYSCQVCARQHDSRKKLVTHAKIHKLTDAEGNLIDPESVVVLNSEFYSNEMQSGLSQQDDGFMPSCDVCFKVFENEAKLTKHRRSAHRDSTGAITSASGSYFYFACELCGLSHLSRSERWKHMATMHSGDPNVTCVVKECSKVFPTSAVKREHETNHHAVQGQYPNTCEVCGKMWKTRVEYWKHMMGVHPECLPFICGVCLKVFCNLPNLVSHVRDTHWPLVGGDFCCDICGRPYSKVSKMTRHRKVHYVPDAPPELQALLENPKIENEHHFLQQPSTLTCDLCQGNAEEYENIEALAKHRFETHDVMPCDLCTKYYGRTSHLWKHVNKIHKGHPDITCPICQRTSASKSHLATHVAKHHRNEEIPGMQAINGAIKMKNGVHACEKCSKVFRKESLVRKHLKHCKGPRPPPMPLPAPVNGVYTCERCSKTFSAQNLLYKHMRCSHVSYKCDICEVKVHSKTDLYNHICEKHENHPDVKCSFTGCDKILRCRSDLERHQRDHRQSVQLHICKFCAEIVTSKFKMKKHLKAMHGKEAKHLCAICLKALSSFKELQSHVESNHRVALDRPNTCPICGKPCSNKSKLMEHIKYHSSSFHPCKICLKILPSKEDLGSHLNNHPSDSGEEEDQIEEVELDANSILDIIGAPKGEIRVKRQFDDDEEEEENAKGPIAEKQPAKKIKIDYTCDKCLFTFNSSAELKNHKECTHKDYGTSKGIDMSNSILHSVLAEGKQETTPSNNKSVTKWENNQIPQIPDTSFMHQLGLMPDEKGARMKNNRKVYSDDFTPSQCEVCGKVWPAKRHLWQHLIRFHRVEAGTSCGICLKLCSSYITLSNHLALDHQFNFDGEGTNLSCKVCGKYHNARSKLQNHVTIHVGHEERAQDSVHHCLICKESFPLFKLFCSHIRNVHQIVSVNSIPQPSSQGSFIDKKDSISKRSDSLPYNGSESSGSTKFPFNSCDVCSLMFASEQGLINHRRIHAHSDSFKCGQCGELFGSKNSLGLHKIERHKGTEFVCADCKSNFTTYLELTEHNKKCKAKLRIVVNDDGDEGENGDDEDEEEDDDGVNESGDEIETTCDVNDLDSETDNDKTEMADSSSSNEEDEDEDDEDGDIDGDDEDEDEDDVKSDCQTISQEEPKVRAIEAYVCDNMVEVVQVDLSDDGSTSKANYN